MTADHPDSRTPDSAARLRAAAADLAAAITVHADAVTALTVGAGITEVLAPGDHLLPAVLAYADAQFEHTGNSYPFGVLHQFVDGEDDPREPATGVSVLQRHDYQVTDEAAVLAAGRRAYLDTWPGDDEAAAAEDVTHVGRALYQVAHTVGWAGLGVVDGLRPTGGAVLVTTQDDVLGPDPDEWPPDLFADAGELVHRQEDVLPG